MDDTSRPTCRFFPRLVACVAWATFAVGAGPVAADDWTVPGGPAPAFGSPVGGDPAAIDGPATPIRAANPFVGRESSDATATPIPPEPFGGSPGRVHLPIDPAGEGERVEVIARDGFFSLTAREAPLSEVLNVLAEGQGVNLVLGDAVETLVTVTLSDVTFDEALNAILSASGFQWTRRGRVVIVTRIGDARATPDAQGREMRVFRLNFISAVDAEKVVRGLLSPAGQVMATATDAKDTRRTIETLMVDDVPESLARVQAYLAQADVPPLQVEIEAHVLEVDLSDELKCGVNFSRLARIGGLGLTVGTQGLVGAAGAVPASNFFLNFDGAKTDALITAIRATTDSKVLASPRLTVLNGQQARIQIGAQLGYLVTTTTQTSTLQNVNFLDVGVVLSVTPHISDDGQVLMFVRPEVSSGRINPQTNLPEEETTEVETAIMLPDGRGMVIGGLIKETDIDSQSKVPVLGDLWVVGRLFQKRNLTRQRSEIVIVLVPRIVPCGGCPVTPQDAVDLDRASSPLLVGPLIEAPRPWEPKLPDARTRPNFPKFPWPKRSVD